MYQVLLDTGILTADGLNLNPKRISSIDNVKIVDTNFKEVKDNKLVADNKMFLSSILEVLGAKGQYDVSEVPTTISVDQINRII